MIYQARLRMFDIVASQTAISILRAAQEDSLGFDADHKVVIGMLWSFNALCQRLADEPSFRVPQPRRGIRDEVRDRIFARDGNRCLKCGSVDALEIDHVVPIAVGGLDVETNFQTLCAPCNRVKHTDPVDYRIPVLDFSASLNGNPA